MDVTCMCMCACCADDASDMRAHTPQDNPPPSLPSLSLIADKWGQHEWGRYKSNEF